MTWFLENLLRGDGYRLEGLAEIESKVRYRHQGGGQEHTIQLRITYNIKKDTKNKRRTITTSLL